MNDDVTQASAAQRTVEAIGPYRLLQRVGEGGMGDVWLAEQTRPVHRQVALKVIKAGMDTAQVVARFEAERQALALMSHPAIAQVFDAGVTPQGRPFFVMEYVRGEAITSYCNRQRLSTRQRLDLFIEVCDGVQHAHQKGIIHRDPAHRPRLTRCRHRRRKPLRCRSEDRRVV
jgi:non-specific serine/threonine protein kinase/serine/threonine-protein kinase